MIAPDGGGRERLTAGSDAAGPRPMPTRTARRRRSLRRVLVILATGLAIEYLVVPQLSGAREALDTLGGVEPGALALGLVLELLAVLSYAQLTRTLIPHEVRPSYGRAARITLSTLGLSHVVPGGAAVGPTLGFRLLTNAGVPPGDAAFTVASQSIGSAVCLNLLLWAGLVVSIPVRGFNPLYGTAAIIGAVLLAVVAAAVVSATRGEDRIVGLVSRAADRVSFLDAEAVADALRRAAARLRDLVADWGLMIRATAWAAANWLLDIAALGVFLAAYGVDVRIDALVISFGLAHVLAAIPLTPGGLGVVEATLTAVLVGFGVPQAEALLGVVTYRLASFWLPIPLGAISYLTLRIRPRQPAGEDLFETATETLDAAPTAREWAEDHGIDLGR